MNWLIAYDISDPKRLRRVARLCERRGLRHQKSVFAFAGRREALDRLLGELRELIDPLADAIQAWRLDTHQKSSGVVLGSPMPTRPPAVVLGPGVRRSVVETEVWPESAEITRIDAEGAIDEPEE